MKKILLHCTYCESTKDVALYDVTLPVFLTEWEGSTDPWPHRELDLARSVQCQIEKMQLWICESCKCFFADKVNMQ